MFACLIFFTTQFCTDTNFCVKTWISCVRKVNFYTRIKLKLARRKKLCKAGAKPFFEKMK